jgi:pyruvate formate lyase activating enzyme
MKIAGFKKQSLIDFPGNISSVVFTQGCNFRCPYCHNPNLVLPEQYIDVYDVKAVLSYITKYKKQLDAVCITGGEPCIQKDLTDFIREVKDLGLKVKLDTNGTKPKLIKKLLNADLLDYIAMDIKHTLDFEKYNLAVGNVLNSRIFNDVLESLALIKSSGVSYEFRTTIAKGLHTQDDLESLKKQDQCMVFHNLNPEIMLEKQSALESFGKDEFSRLLDL